MRKTYKVFSNGFLVGRESLTAEEVKMRENAGFQLMLCK